MLIAHLLISANAVTLTATVDNELIVYSEGANVASNSDWGKTTVVQLDDPCVLAIEGRCDGHICRAVQEFVLQSSIRCRLVHHLWLI